MGRYIIGDIHGCDAELAYLLESLPLASGDTVVFLGDYIDRGPNSRAVVSRVLSLPQDHANVEFIFLKGNHEDMFLSYLGIGGQHGNMFLPNGGQATLASYDLNPGESTREKALATVPPSHLEFFRALRTSYVMNSFLCVHAGIHPEKRLAEQTEEELLWIRNAFIYRSHNLPYTVVFGHTPQASVFYDLPYKVGIDTGLVWGNMLTCLEVDEKVLFQIGRGKKSVNRSSAERGWRSPSASPP
jgi:serine/threonine protein phosphatase 1